jgi:hypothetical protein
MLQTKTVDELIAALEEVEDKSPPVFVLTRDWIGMEINHVAVGEARVVTGGMFHYGDVHGVRVS